MAPCDMAPLGRRVDIEAPLRYIPITSWPAPSPRETQGRIVPTIVRLPSMFRLFPREEKFFDLFEQQAQHIVSAARVLEEMTVHFANVKSAAERIKDLEHAGDTLTHEIVRRLNTTFITPIDREDIYALASRLDDVLDLIDAVAGRLLLYRIETPTDGCIAMAKIIVKTAEETDRAVRCLRTLSPYYHKHAIEVNRLENEADRLLRDQLAALFEGTKDAIEVIKWKELYETMEAVTDRCEDVVNVIEGITLKMA
jgi:predicted phosphate transport protein (TIGR00153 family)